MALFPPSNCTSIFKFHKHKKPHSKMQSRVWPFPNCDSPNLRRMPYLNLESAKSSLALNPKNPNTHTLRPQPDNGDIF